MFDQVSMDVVSNEVKSAKIFVAVRCECGQGEDGQEEDRHERVRRSLNSTTHENGTDVRAAR